MFVAHPNVFGISIKFDYVSYLRYFWKIELSSSYIRLVYLTLCGNLFLGSMCIKGIAIAIQVKRNNRTKKNINKKCFDL